METCSSPCPLAVGGVIAGAQATIVVKTTSLGVRQTRVQSLALPLSTSVNPGVLVYKIGLIIVDPASLVDVRSK